MLTLIIIVKQRKIQNDIISLLETFCVNVQILFATEEGNDGLTELENRKENVRVVYFPRKTSEEDMIESLIDYVDGQTLCIVRDDNKPINVNLIKRCIVKQKEGYDIVMPKNNKKTNFFKKFFKKITNALVYKVFGFNLFEGNISIQCFGNNSINILKTNRTGTLTKVNKWLGANIGYVDDNVDNFRPKAKKLGKLKLWTILYFMLFIVFLSSTIALPILFSLPWLVVLLLIFGTLIGISLSLFNFLRFYIKYQVGELIANKVEIIKSGNNE